jgi:chlorinating enzyme
MLSDSQLDIYAQDGYVVPEYRVPVEMLEDIKSRHSRLVETKPEYADYCPALLDHDLGFAEYCQQPEILDMVEQIIGPDFALWNTSFFAKPAFKGTTTPWHQDGEYWPIRPLATCTVWLAIDASTTENGCLRVIKGSHKDGTLKKHQTNNGPGLALNRELLESEYDEAQAVDIELEPGQMSLHDIFLLHGSEPNRSPNSRRGMTMRFMPTTSLFDREIAAEQAKQFGFVSHENRQVLLMRGRDSHGGNEFYSC